MTHKTLLLVATILLSVCGKTPHSSTPIPKALLIVVDGVPADVVESVPTPYLDAISSAGGYTRAYVGGTVGTATESPTVSAVSYNCLLTGTWANKHNVWGNAISRPNYDYWDIFRIAKNHDSTLLTAVFSTWTDNRTKLLGDGLESAGGHKLDFYADGYELDTGRFPHDLMAHYIRDIDEVVTAEAAKHISTEGPHLSWVYLQYTDDIGHRYGDGPEMAAAVRVIDDQVGRIWSAIENRKEMHNEDWMIVVTTDHGRDVATGRNHGEYSERERTIWIVTNSADLNSHFEEQPAIVDILPSIATHLDLDMPENIRDQLDGRSFVD